MPKDNCDPVWIAVGSARARDYLVSSGSVGGCYLEPDVMRRGEVSKFKVFCGDEAVELANVSDMGQESRMTPTFLA